MRGYQDSNLNSDRHAIWSIVTGRQNKSELKAFLAASSGDPFTNMDKL